MPKNDKPTIILVLGPDGSGKSLFAQCFKHSFLQSLPSFPLYRGILSGASFYSVSSLVDEKDVSLLAKAKKKGYRIIVYVLFAARILCAERNRLQSLINGVYWQNVNFRDDYETFYDRLLAIYPDVDMVFFVNNQKEFEFLGVYDINDAPLSSFEKILRKQKAASDRIRIN